MGGAGQVGDPGVTAQLRLAPTLWERGGGVDLFQPQVFFTSPFILFRGQDLARKRFMVIFCFPRSAWCLCCIPTCVGCGWDGRRGGALPSRDLGLQRVPTRVCCMAQVGWLPDPPTFYFPAVSIATCLEDHVSRPFFPVPFTAAFRFRGGKVWGRRSSVHGSVCSTHSAAPGARFFSKTLGSHPKELGL